MHLCSTECVSTGISAQEGVRLYGLLLQQAESMGPNLNEVVLGFVKVCACACVHACMCVSMHLSVCVCVCVHAFTCVCVCVDLPSTIEPFPPPLHIP
jgi:hypothetical protein